MDWVRRCGALLSAKVRERVSDAWGTSEVRSPRKLNRSWQKENDGNDEDVR